MMDVEAVTGSNDPDELKLKDFSEEVISREGDLWQLGNHLLLCGNALDTISLTICLSECVRGFAGHGLSSAGTRSIMSLNTAVKSIVCSEIGFFTILLLDNFKGICRKFQHLN